jgi:hypothetical protein
MQIFSTYPAEYKQRSYTDVQANACRLKQLASIEFNRVLSMQSHSVNICPLDSRCRYWAKISRSGQTLPLPSDVSGADDLTGPYLKRGEEELLPGDVLFEGEANHHRRTDRGWTYWVGLVLPSGELLRFKSGFNAQKMELKRQGMSPELLMGSGDIASMVRIAHGARMGMTLTMSPE